MFNHSFSGAKSYRLIPGGLLVLAIALLQGCDGGGSNTQKSGSPSVPQDYEFTLQFKAKVGAMEVNCDDLYSGLGPDGNYSIGVGDLRFYVSNLKFYTDNGNAVAPTLDDNDFQLNHAAGSVALIDFSDKNSGYCDVASEGTPRTNTQITGTVSESAITSVSFDVGVPQATMKAVIAATDNVNDTPSPLGEMIWSWASGYRHFVINFTAMDATHMDRVENSGFHLGSRDCGTAGKALSDQDECGLLHTPKVMLTNFDPAVNTVVVDIASLLANAQDTDFNPGNNFGIQCHSSATQTACVSLFPNFGLDISTGLATPGENIVFRKE